MCHTRLCLHDIRSIVLVAKPRAEKFKVTSHGGDFQSVLDPMVKMQFRKNAVIEDCDVTIQVRAARPTIMGVLLGYAKDRLFL